MAANNVFDNNPDGGIFGALPTAVNPGKIAFYGATPVIQRASSIQAASVVSAQSFISVTSNLSAFCAEVAATLTALSLWKGAA